MSQHKTPLRYPGGKQRLAPFIKEIIELNNLRDGDYAEPYAGGAGVAFELLLNRVVSNVHINDSCKGIYSFWRSILRKPEAFCRKIRSVPLTVKEWRKQREIYMNPRGSSQFDYGFATFYLNRCNRSGILNAGVIGGVNQNGNWKIDARFHREELIKRIEAIANRKNNIKVKNLDAEEYIKTYVKKLPRKTLVYLDPPYFNKADRLYRNHYNSIDHERISVLIQNKLKRPWIVSYDDSPEIVNNYRHMKSISYDLQYNAAKAYMGKEIFIFSDRISIPKISIIKNIDKAL